MGPGEKCLVPTDKWFCKDPEDIKSCGVKTCSHTKKELTVNNQAIDNTFNIEHWTMDSWNTTSFNGKRRSFLCFIKWIVFLLMVFIMNNRIILRGGRGERKCLERKYNEL